MVYIEEISFNALMSFGKCWLGSSVKICLKHAPIIQVLISARCKYTCIYISHLCYDVSVRPSVCLSVTGVHWRILANLRFKFRLKFTAHCRRGDR